jgi:ATP-dependent DNA ligase
VTPATRDPQIAADWFSRFEGAGLDGVMAKPISGVYEPGKRVIFKIKHERDCDCVVAGFRWHKNGRDRARDMAVDITELQNTDGNHGS